MKPANYLVFTDLDGTLLDFNTYSPKKALPAIERLKAAGIPIIFCSSKSRAEQEVIRAELGITDPFITENGSAVYIPKGTFANTFPFQKETDAYFVLELGQPVHIIRKAIALARLSSSPEFLGYADLSLAEIVRLTGLDEPAAYRAAKREYSETILTGDKGSPEFGYFCEILEAHELSCVSGGKFHTVMGQGSDKGQAMEALAAIYCSSYQQDFITVALGDSANDLPLLAAAQRSFLVQKPGGRWQKIELKNLSRISGVGPEGWNMAINTLL